MNVRHLAVCLILVLAALPLFPGCSRPPAVEFENLPLISSLRTACSARNDEWLKGVARAVEVRHEKGHMTAQEKGHFELLIAQAREGDWQGAEKKCFQFEKAQLNRKRSSPPTERHAHRHDHKHHRKQVSVAGR
jgi:hypothetical protein